MFWLHVTNILDFIANTAKNRFFRLNFLRIFLAEVVKTFGTIVSLLVFSKSN